MFFIKKIINQIAETEKTIDSGITLFNLVLDFGPISQEYDILRALNFKNKGFTKDQFEFAVEKLLDRNHGYYSYKALSFELGDGDEDEGQEIVSALIAENILHFRPTSKMARDLIPYPPYSVVTAISQPALRAMELIMNEKKAGN